MSAILKLFAWLLAVAVAFATLGPASLRPHSDFGQNGEHAFAFLLVGIAFALAYKRNRPLTAAITIALIGVLEILQLWAPGRHARLGDFVVDALAASAGLLLVTGVEWFLARRSSPGTT
jgi:VanZ family protein